jgi:hypothetical protein
MDPAAAAYFACLQDDISRAIPTLSTHLTNAGSDWLDSLLAGGLSFSQFRTLNPKTFRTLVDNLQNWQAEVEIASIKSKYHRNEKGEVYTMPPTLEGIDLDGTIIILKMVKDLNSTLKVKNHSAD